MGLYDMGNTGVTTPVGLPEPGARKPSLLARVASRLFPLDPSFASVLTPDERSGLTRSSLQRFGVGLLAAGGPRPKGTANFGSRLAEAYGGAAPSAQDVQQILQLRDYQQKQAEQAQLQDILAANPAPDGETDEQARARLLNVQNQLLASGHVELADKLSQMIRLHEPQTGLVQVKSPSGTRVDLVSPLDGHTIRSIDYAAKDATEPDQSRQWRTSLATEFTQQTQREHLVADGMSRLLTLAQQPQSKARDQALLTAYAQTIDPRATFAQATATPGERIGGLPGEVANLWAAVFNGQTKLDKATVDELISNARALAQDSFNRFNGAATFYEGAARNHGVDPGEVVDRSVWRGTGFLSAAEQHSVVTDGDCVLHPETCRR